MTSLIQYENRVNKSVSELISCMEMRLNAPVTRGYFFLLSALRLVNAASPRNSNQKKISSGTQGSSIELISLIWVSLERSFPPAELEYR